MGKKRQQIVWVTHVPSGLSGYGRVEDMTVCSQNKPMLIIEVGQELAQALDLMDRIIDLRYTADYKITSLVDMPHDLN